MPRARTAVDVSPRVHFRAVRGSPALHTRSAGLWLALGLLCASPVPAAETTAAEPPPLYRYLVIVDVSRDMARLREAAADTVSRILMNGIQGRIQPGHVVGLWLVGDQFHTNGIAPEMWIPSRAVDLGNQAFRAVRDQELSKSSLSIEAVVQAVRAVGRESERLTVLLVTSGFAPLSGTEFDDEVNFLFQNHREKMRKVRRPFVLVLQLEGERIAAHSASPGGGVIHIPPFPKAPAR